MSSPVKYYTTRCTLPSAWDTRAPTVRSQNALQYLSIDGLRVRYKGPGEEDTQAATVRANYPLPLDVPLFYFEVEIISKGADGYIGIGFISEDGSLAKLPGWEANSYGYHGDDGHAFSGSGLGRAYGPKYTTGDVIGALFNRMNRSITYFKNGTEVGVAFTDVRTEPLFPCVGMRTRGEEVVGNFGASPFKLDFLAYLSAHQDRLLATVKAMPLPLLSSKGTSLMPQLIYDHLMHHRYWQTAGVLARDLLSKHGQLDESQLSDITNRQKLYELVSEGRIDEALSLLHSAYSSEVLDASPHLRFRLKVQKFVQLIKEANRSAASISSSAPCGSTSNGHAAGGSSSSAAANGAGAASTSTSGAAGGGGSGGSGSGGVVGMDAALAYGRSELAVSCRSDQDQELLQDALSLLAYDNPESSPCGYLLKQSHRVALAEELNGAILAHRGLPAASPLERLYQQAVTVITELKRGDHPQSLLLPDVRKLALEGAAVGSGKPLSPAPTSAACGSGLGV